MTAEYLTLSDFIYIVDYSGTDLKVKKYKLTSLSRTDSTKILIKWRSERGAQSTTFTQTDSCRLHSLYSKKLFLDEQEATKFSNEKIKNAIKTLKELQ